MSTMLATKTAMRRLAAEAQSLTKSGASLAEKKARLDGIEAEMRSHQETISTLEGANRLAFLGDSTESDDTPTSWAASKSFGGAPLTPSVEQLKALHYAATSKQSLRLDVDTKTPLDLTAPGIIPPQLAPGILAFRREPFRVASLFPSSGTDAPSVEYVQHTSTTGVATVVAAGAAKPELTLVTTTVTAYARKIAAHIGVLSETLADFQTTAGYVTQELVNALIAAENAQLLTGSGVAPNMQGILTTTGVLTRTQAAAPETALDTLELAMTDLRVGASFTEPTGFVMHPSDLSAVRHLKDTQGRYLVGAPTDAAPATLWGKPVVLTTSIAAKTVLCGNFAEGGQLLVREGVRMETSNSSGTDFTTNVVRFLGELRETLLIFGSPVASVGDSWEPLTRTRRSRIGSGAV